MAAGPLMLGRPQLLSRAPECDYLTCAYAQGAAQTLAAPTEHAGQKQQAAMKAAPEYCESELLQTCAVPHGCWTSAAEPPLAAGREPKA